MESTNSFDDKSNMKIQREQFVQGLNGSSMGDVLSILSQVPLFVFITLFIKLCLLTKLNIDSIVSKDCYKVKHTVFLYLLELSTIVFPLVLMFTVFSDSVLLIFLGAISIIIAMITISVSFVNDSVNYWKIPHFKRALLKDDSLLGIGQRPFLTYFRALTYMVTSISILAVDFHIFPRRFAKTETYGVSLMDIGVGLFVFANAIVTNENKLLIKRLKDTMLESLVFIIFGIVRYVCIQRLDYQKHVTEYGEHWNFFITLGLVKLLSHMLVKLSRGHSFLCGIFSLVVHQYVLSHSLEEFVISDFERDNLFSANREGIVSLGGYLSLYLIVVAFAKMFNPDKPLNLKKKLNLLAVVASICVFLFALLYWLHRMEFEVSRRLANLPYTVWVIAVGLTLLTITLAIELMSVCFLPLPTRLSKELYSLVTPALLDSVNFNGLVFFLVSNLLTGLINIFFDVYSMGSLPSLAVLSGYMFLNCSIVFVMYLLDIRFKVV